MVYRSRSDLALFPGRNRLRRHTERKRQQCAACWSYHLLWGASGNASLVRHGLGRSSLHECELHAASPPHQLWRYTTVSNASLKQKGGSMNLRRFFSLLLL